MDLDEIMLIAKDMAGIDKRANGSYVNQPYTISGIKAYVRDYRDGSSSIELIQPAKFLRSEILNPPKSIVGKAFNQPPMSSEDWKALGDAAPIPNFEPMSKGEIDACNERIDKINKRKPKP